MLFYYLLACNISSQFHCCRCWLKVLWYFSLMAFKIVYLTWLCGCSFIMCLGSGFFFFFCIFLLGVDVPFRTEIYDFNEYRKKCQPLYLKILILHHPPIPTIVLFSPWGIPFRDMFAYLILSLVSHNLFFIYSIIRTFHLFTLLCCVLSKFFRYILQRVE